MHKTKRMKKMQIELPAKRDSVLYVRVSEANKAFLEKTAKDAKCSVSALLDVLIDGLRLGEKL